MSPLVEGQTKTNWYLDGREERVNKMKEYAAAWEALEKKRDEAKDAYYKFKKAHYDATNVAVTEGLISQSDGVGYIAEVKTFNEQRKIRMNAEENKKKLERRNKNIETQTNNHRRNQRGNNHRKQRENNRRNERGDRVQKQNSKKRH